MGRLIPIAILFLALCGLGIKLFPAAPTPPPPLPIPCSSEDGSDYGQQFPCLWTGGANGRGYQYWITEPDKIQYISK